MLSKLRLNHEKDFYLRFTVSGNYQLFSNYKGKGYFRRGWFSC